MNRRYWIEHRLYMYAIHAYLKGDVSKYFGWLFLAELDMMEKENERRSI